MGSKMTSTFAYPCAGITPYMGSTMREFEYYSSPFTDYLSNVYVKGTSSVFFMLTISLFFPPISNGPKLIFPISKKTLGYFTLPTIRKC